MSPEISIFVGTSTVLNFLVGGLLGMRDARNMETNRAPYVVGLLFDVGLAGIGVVSNKEVYLTSGAAGLFAFGLGYTLGRRVG